MTQDMTFQQVGSTLPFPGKHVVGVFGSLQEAEQAVQALVDAGYHAEDMALIKSQDFSSALQEHRRKEGRYWQMMHQLQITTDEGSLRELLEAPAPQGSAIIFLYVPRREHLDEVSALLFNHGARPVKFVGNWSVEDLIPPLKEENVSVEAPTRVGDEPESDEQRPGQALQPSASTRPQDRGSEQALRSTAAEVARLFVLAARSAHSDAEKQGQLRAFLERSRTELAEFIHGSSQHPQQTNTTQGPGQPGVEYPPIGRDGSSAYAPIMDTSDLDAGYENE